MQRKHIIYLLIILGAITLYLKIDRPKTKEQIPQDIMSTHKVTDKHVDIAIDSSSQPVSTTSTSAIENYNVNQSQQSEQALLAQEHAPVTQNPAPYIGFNLVNTAEELFVSQQTLSLKEEKKRLRSFDGFITPQEKVFFNAYQAKISARKQTLRLNIAFNRDFIGKGQNFCLSVKDDISQEILFFAPEREIKLLRSDDPGYLAISVENEIFLQVFATSDKKPNKLKSYISLANESQKIPIVLEEKPSQYDGTYLSCENFW
jgi:hypothetical protein